MIPMTASGHIQAIRDEPMSRHTSWQVGGPADLYYAPESEDALVAVIRSLPSDIPLTLVGLGSNLLVRDGGVRGAVVSTTRALTYMNPLEGGVVEAGAGVACTLLARRCVRWGLGPAEFFAGIPGSIGGALTMNAGAFGGETWERVLDVRVVTRSGQILTRRPDDYRVDYREVHGPRDEWFVSARFQFQEDFPSTMDKVQELVKERALRQPLGLPSCGSVFRNPEGDFAARLIETAGLKGHRIGGAIVSTKHANFIINEGNATAADVEQLIEYVRSTVEQVHGVTLQKEVHIMGDPV